MASERRLVMQEETSLTRSVEHVRRAFAFEPAPTPFSARFGSCEDLGRSTSPRPSPSPVLDSKTVAPDTQFLDDSDFPKVAQASTLGLDQAALSPPASGSQSPRTVVRSIPSPGSYGRQSHRRDEDLLWNAKQIRHRTRHTQRRQPDPSPQDTVESEFSSLDVDSLRREVDHLDARVHVESFAKAVRRVRKKIDAILMKGMQLQQERSRLRDCRRFLHESISELVSNVQAHRPTEPSRSRIEANKESEGGVAGLELSGEPEHSGQRTASSFAEATPETTTDEFSHDDAESLGSDTTTGSQRQFAALFQRYLDDFEALASQDERERELAAEVDNEEFHLKRLLEIVQTTMHSHRFAADLRTEMLEGTELSTETSRRTASDDELPPLVKQYFDRHQDIGIFLERLQELDFAYQEGVTEREFLRDRGDELDPSDEEFEANYRNQRQQTEEDLGEARHELEQVAQSCRETGLDPEAYRNVQHSPASFSLHPLDISQDAGALQLETAEQATLDPPLSPALTGRASLHIEGWLDDIDDCSMEGESALSPLASASSDEPVGLSLAGFEFESFDVGVFGLPKKPEGREKHPASS